MLKSVVDRVGHEMNLYFGEVGESGGLDKPAF
jgi:hypothetical protein